MRIRVNNEVVYERDREAAGYGQLVVSLFDSGGRQVAHIRLEIELRDAVDVYLNNLTPQGERELLRRIIMERVK